MKWSMVIPLLLLAAMAAAQTPKLTVRGKDLVDPSGKVVPLRGCNLGNWLMIELWMLGLSEKSGVSDQYSLFKTLDDRFGRSTREELIDVYRSNWITDKDFQTIESFRFNLVRLPMDYRLFEDDERPMVLRKDAFKWIDRCIKLARAHGIYVILDMHGLQGGQSPYDHTGQSGQNKFWTVPENQARAQWLWGKIAQRYRDNSTVVAYDLGNEPYGGTHALQVAAYPKLLEAVRASDPEKLCFIHGHYDGFAYYGDPTSHGWHNVGYQMHYYPGLFGNGNPSVNTHVRHFSSLGETIATVDKWNVPFLIGEMNPVFAKVGVDMMRRHFDFYASHGWFTTMWSYKVVTEKGGFDGGSWGMVTNSKALPPINFKTSTLAEIRRWFKGVGSVDWQVYSALRDTMAPVSVNLPPLPAELPRRVDVPESTPTGAWKLETVGNAKPGAVVKKSDGFELYGSGDDIWGDKDGFSFLHQSVVGDFEAIVTVTGMDDWETYAKAGWMARAGTEPNAAHVLASVFPDGSAQYSERKKAGATTDGQEQKSFSFPLDVKLVRHGADFTGYVREKGKDWTVLGQSSRPELPLQLELGLVALSHDARSFCRIVYTTPVVVTSKN